MNEQVPLACRVKAKACEFADRGSTPTGSRKLRWEDNSVARTCRLWTPYKSKVCEFVDRRSTPTDAQVGGQLLYTNMPLMDAV